MNFRRLDFAEGLFTRQGLMYPLDETLNGCELSLFRHLNTKGFDFEHGYITSDDLTL